MSRTPKTVEVVAGDAIVGVFSSEAKAKAFRKELKENGVESKMYITLGEAPKEEKRTVELPKRKETAAPKKRTDAPKKKTQAKRKTAPVRGPNPIDEESIARSIRAGIRKGCRKEGMDEKDFSAVPERSGDSLHTVIEGPDGVKALISIIHGDRAYSYEIVGPRNRLDDTGFSIPEEDIPKVTEGLAESVVSMIRTEIERRSAMTKDPFGGKVKFIDGSGRKPKGPAFEQLKPRFTEVYNELFVKQEVYGDTIKEGAEAFEGIRRDDGPAVTPLAAYIKAMGLSPECARAAFAFAYNESTGKGKRFEPRRTGPDPPSAKAIRLSGDLYWNRTYWNGWDFLDEVHVVGKKGVYRLRVERIRYDEDSEWTMYLEKGGVPVERPRQLRLMNEGVDRRAQLCRARAVEMFLRHDKFVAEATETEHEMSLKDGSGRLKAMRDPRKSIWGWYGRAFPDDEVNDDHKVSDETFGDVVRAIRDGKDVYDAMGENDSVVRERVFREIADRNGIAYEDVHDAWLGNNRWIRGSVGADGVVKVSAEQKRENEYIDGLLKRFHEIDDWMLAHTCEDDRDYPHAAHVRGVEMFYSISDTPEGKKVKRQCMKRDGRTGFGRGVDMAAFGYAYYESIGAIPKDAFMPDASRTGSGPRDRPDGPGDGGKKKQAKKSKPRNLSASKGQYSASYYERLERDLRRAEKEGDNEAIIAITREIAESMSAEGEEIPDAKAYLEDSDYDELARNSRWKYDSRELNRRYLQKVRDEQRMFGNANRKKKARKGARRWGML